MKKTVSLAATLFAISLGTLSSCHAPVPYGTDIDVAKKCAISIFSFDEDGKGYCVSVTKKEDKETVLSLYQDNLSEAKYDKVSDAEDNIFMNKVNVWFDLRDRGDGFIWILDSTGKGETTYSLTYRHYEYANFPLYGRMTRPGTESYQKIEEIYQEGCVELNEIRTYIRHTDPNYNFFYVNR